MHKTLKALTTFALTIGTVSTAPAAIAETAVLNPVRDATLYQNDSGAIANGAGQHLFIARTASGNRRRAVLAFDIAGQIPVGSTILTASLTLNVSNVPPGVNPVGTEVHRVLVPWGEGVSNAPGQEGVGTTSEPGDATWLHTFFPDDLWSEEGGDFDPTPRASEVVGNVGGVTWGSTPEMVADVQDWLDDPASNNGWILVGDGFAFQTAKRLDSREHPDPARRPQLTIDFLAPPVTEIPTLSIWGLVALCALLVAAAARRLA